MLFLILFVETSFDKIFNLRIEGKMNEVFSYSWTGKIINDKMIIISLAYKCSLTGDEVLL